MNARKFIFYIIVALLIKIAGAAPSLEKIDDTIVDTKALNLGEKKYGRKRQTHRILNVHLWYEGMTSDIDYQTGSQELGSQELVQTNQDGRVRYSREQCERIMDLFEQSGISGKAFAEKQGIKVSDLCAVAQEAA